MHFENEPALDLASPGTREALLSELKELDSRLPIRATSLVGGRRLTGTSVRSLDPSKPERVVALADQVTPREIDAAVELARRGGREWAAVPASQRADTLRAAAILLRERRLELAALMVRETGKPWDEADGEVAEAIDFIHFYAGAVEELPVALAPMSHEHDRNSLRLVPRGVTAVIAPWNFPLAIPIGMTVGALVSGNAVILKPAEQAPACGEAAVGVFRDAGVPPEALGLIQGRGSVGAGLVRHPDVATIAFTGSSTVGCEIIAAAARVAPGQRHLKHVVAEMGGKNCAIVAPGADLEETTAHLVQSAFSYAGQKCSAVSRVLVHASLADELTERLGEAVEQLAVGEPADFGTLVPPLIDEPARARLERAVADAEASGRVVGRGRAPGGDGHYVAPTVVADLPPESPLLRDELFGPLLTIEAFDAVEEAAERVDQLPQALVGGIYTRDQDLMDRLISHSPVGNLYVNRPTVGALVGRQPFGGGRLSGTGHKAGGLHYLAAFCDQQVVAERRPIGG